MSWIWLGAIALLLLGIAKGVMDTASDFKTNVESNLNTTVNDTKTTFDKIKTIGESDVNSPLWLLILLVVFILFIVRK